jgi:hypothetical protein
VIPEFWLVGWVQAIVAAMRMLVALWLLRLTFIF